MSARARILGIDVGTTGSKAVLIDASGLVLAAATHEYALSTPRPNWAEQNPNHWWTATVSSIKAVLQQAGDCGASVRCVGLSGQMHGATLLDGAGRVLRPAILWNDQRTAEQCKEITRRVGAQRVVELTGNPVLTGFTAPKLLWVKQHEPEIYANIAAVLLPKDYVRYCLTDERRSDVSDASGTSLFDVANRRWSPEMLEAVGVRREWLPEVTESPVVSAHISAEAASATGLTAGTPVVGGASDQAAQAVGAGIVAEGCVSVTLGTSGVVFAASQQYRVDPGGRLHAFCHAVPGLWHLMGVMLSAGGSLRWFRDALCEAESKWATEQGREVYELLTESAAAVSPGAEGLLFLPYLSGERTPHADPDARGAFVGLSLRHGKAHMTRAVLEGVAFGLRDSLELMRDLGLSPREVRGGGGGMRSSLWRQIIADVFACPIALPSVGQGAAYGAALLAAVGADIFSSVAEAADATVRVAARTDPGPDRGAYERIYPNYRALYPALIETFRAIVQRGGGSAEPT